MSDDESVYGEGTGGGGEGDEGDSDNGDGELAANGGGAYSDPDDEGTPEDAGDEDEDEEDAVPEADPSDVEEAAPPSQPAARKTGGGGTGIMAHFFGKQGAKPAAPAPEVTNSKPPATSRPKGGKAAAASRATQPVALGKQNAAKGAPRSAKEPERSKASTAATQSSKKGEKPAASTFSFHNDSDEEEEEEAPLTYSAPKHVRPPMPAPDVEQDYLDTLAGGANGRDGAADADGEGEEPPRVAEMAKQRRYIIKNEKTGRWAEWKANGPNGLLYAPESADLFSFTKEFLTVPSKKDRLLVQDKLANEQMSKIMGTMMIGGIKPDGTESNGAPGITNVMALIPSVPPLVGKELEELWKWMELTDEDEVELVAVLALDHEIVKRVYKVPNGPLPAIYNPNTNSGNKYKVPAVLEKIKEHDENFVLWSPETKAKGRAPKRGATEEASPSKADGKRPATGAKSTSAKGVPGEVPDCEGIGPGEYSDTFFKGFTDEGHAISYAKLTCKDNEVFSVLRCGNGKWLLLKSLE